VTASLGTGVVTGADGNDTITPGTVERLTSSNFADSLTGEGAGNVLSGGAGNDT